MFTLLLFSIALASDAFAVALARGACSGHDWKKALGTGLAFGLAQGGAAIVGCFIGGMLSGSFQAAENYLACAALIILGIMMIRGAMKHHADPTVCEVPPGALRALVGLVGAALIVSLDCLAAGVALPLLGFHILIDALVIFTVSFLLSTAGYRLGSHAGQKLGKYAEIGGGVILIAIGIHIVA